jgi:protein-tyrosine phosphatase
MTQQWPRTHKIVGAFNFRDLGGLPTNDGGHTIFGQVFRSDALDYLTAADYAIMIDALQIGCVIDLRADVETGGVKPTWTAHLSAELVNLPLSDDWDDWGVLDDESRKTLLARRYLSYLNSASTNVIAGLELIANNAGSRPTVIHCAVGKDRTGVLVSMLLSLLNVERAAIIRDYVETASNMAPIMERLSSSEVYRKRIESNPAEVYHASEHTVTHFLESLDENDGGPEGWARSHGLTDETIGQLRSALTSDAEL